MISAIVGANWGDEGKGKITDILAEKADVVIRFQGGSNAGHTIINEYGKFALHQVPSGVFYKHTTNIIGNGTALNIPYFLKEVDALKKSGLNPQILISDRAQILMPYHILFDINEEERLSDKQFGSTKSGIAPFYSDKYAKNGIQVNELFYPERLKEKLGSICEIKNVLMKHLYNKPPIDPNAIFDELMNYRELIQPYISNTFEYLQKAIRDNKNILLEGQLGALKDPDHGIYPFTTSSPTLAGYATVGAGIPPHKIKKVIAVVKAYSSAVGSGPFVSEIFGDEADTLRRRGGDAGEYGATTGRPRRMGWLDVVASRYGCQVQGATEVALTVLDVLSYLDVIPVCIGYDIDGVVTESFAYNALLEEAKPVFEYLPGWKVDIRGITDFNKLPKNCKNYIMYIERALGIPITIVTNGPKRHEVIVR